jgi:pimeloyl-ACP methyl ester carboxylesterase
MTLAFEESGQGPAIVLLHGFPLDRSLWDAQRIALSDRYRVIVPDLPGHGQSPRLADPPTIDGMADAVRELLDGLGLTGPVVLGGLSMGGYVALSFAARFLDRLRGLMLFDTRSIADPPEVAAGRKRSAQEIDATGSVENLVSAMLPKLFAESTRKKNPALVSATEQLMQSSDPASVAASLRAMAGRADRTKALDKITVPCLVCVGEMDAISTPAEMQEIARRLPNGRFVQIPAAGHLTPIENPEAVTESIATFLSGPGG